MLNIKSVFVPPEAAPMNSMDLAQQNVGPTPQKPIKSGFNSSKTRLFLGAAFLFLTLIGGASAMYLSTTGQDLRQQAAEIPGYGKDCSGFTTKPGQAYCGSTAPNSCLRCVDGKGELADNSACAGLPCDANSQFNQPKCSGGASPGQEACAGGPNDICDGGSCCKICEVFSPGANQSPQAKWVNNPGGCSGLVCSKTATPTPGGPVSSCGDINFVPGAANCSTINADGCFAYRTCHAGSNYDACVPNAGTNMCTYTTDKGMKCTAPCPGSVGELGPGSARCQCSNGQWTIGVLPPGGSCEQLCACTGNVCTDCKPTKPPSEKTPTPPKVTITATPSPTPTPVPPAQCTNIKMLTPEGAELTGNDDQSLQPGDAVKFMCAANGAVARYEFRVIMPDGSVQTAANNPNLVAVGATTGNFVLPAIGKFTAQCRICTMPVCPPGANCKLGGDPICQEYEPVPGVSIAPTITTIQSCGGIAGLTCPTGYSCDAPRGVPDAMGTCVLESARGT